ncbi:MAG: CHRD domain-containing protein [Fimbriimonadaceae bacterium]|nr:CHRD domain-containing protein [Fimbriimonadaceae bacterium]QYK55629.1 MAG: CHRD domain-containing protein [Fimbriimonadaceae bacterium]
MRNYIRGLAALAALAAFVPARAFVWTINNVMDASQEVPPNNSPATGTIVGTYDDVTKVLDITIAFRDLTSDQTAAHVHHGARGVNGPVEINIGVGNPKQLVAVLDATQEARLLSEQYYVNVHTVINPGGEIRGQITPVPEPATLLALGAGLAALAARRKRV